MKKAITEMYVKMASKFYRLKEDERGSQTLEWIGIAAVIVILVGVISTAMADADSIGDTIVEKIEEFIEGMG